MRPIQISRNSDFLQPWLTLAPPQILQHAPARQQSIRNRALEQNLAISIPVDAIVQDVCGQHLHHANLTGPGTRGLCGIKAALGRQGDGGKHLRLEQFRATTIMGQGQKGVPGVEIALHRAVVGFKRPECQKHAARHAKSALRLVEDGRVALRILAPMIHPVLADHPACELCERHLENALPPVAAQGATVLCGTLQEAVHRGLWQTLRQSLCTHILQKGRKGSATRNADLALGGQGSKQRGRKQFEKTHLPISEGEVPRNLTHPLHLTARRRRLREAADGA